ncbi:hypothetical protein B0T22DRAFT_476302 [Podospora appendiculata]|uniref:Uncharacterized protein n=1 Tax=Podospora appendiculata TaxID=314037 RepID=A0AAE0XHE9_9PEZI|nr:hypothetical protein B0T22DRAFT_476302 [Podospora appendiculata]
MSDPRPQYRQRAPHCPFPPIDIPSKPLRVLVHNPASQAPRGTFRPAEAVPSVAAAATAAPSAHLSRNSESVETLVKHEEGVCEVNGKPLPKIPEKALSTNYWEVDLEGQDQTAADNGQTQCQDNPWLFGRRRARLDSRWVAAFDALLVVSCAMAVFLFLAILVRYADNMSNRTQ